MMDPYKVLGVAKTATEDEIKKVYRTLAKKYHPDLNPGSKDSEQKFKEVNEAYSMVGTKEAREKYDRGETMNEEFYREAGRQRSGPYYRQYQDAGGKYSYFYQGDAEDLFGSFFEGFGQRGGDFNMRGRDQVYKMEVDLSDAVNGAEREIMMPDGKRLKVKIPPGIDEGARLRFKGQGSPAMGKGEPGDAYVEISIKPSDIFRRAGNDLEIEVPVTLDEAVSGAKIKVPTIDGTVMLTVPAGVNTGTKLRVKGKGMPVRGGKERGDQIVTLKVVLPDKIDSQFSEFIKKWSAGNPYNPRPY